jgi:hypothetical protein
MQELKIINFKSEPKNNFFAPEWNYFMCETIFKNIDCKSLAKFLLKKEKEIIKLKPTMRQDALKYTDGYTGLGENSTTARFQEYNVFNFKNKEISKLKKKIIQMHNVFLKTLNLPIPNNLYVQCWYNVMEKGQKINPHIHGFNSDTYLGGHFCVQTKDTSTYYINPVNQINEPETYQSQNKTGKLTLFQNCIPHYTDENKSNLKRITIAFDLGLVNSIKNSYKLF